jgi:hypothetical protein
MLTCERCGRTDRPGPGICAACGGRMRRPPRVIAPAPPRVPSKLGEAYGDALGGVVTLGYYGAWALCVLIVIGLALRLVLGVAGLG